MSRPTGKSPEDVLARKDAFLASFEESVTDKEACEKAGISRATLYRWLQEDEEFAARVQSAEGARAKNLEARMFNVLNWATQDETKYDKILRYPNLLMFALRGLLPQKYGYKLGVSQDEAKKIIDALMGMKDETPVRDGAVMEDALDVLGILGAR
jgi:hypothetical protein